MYKRILIGVLAVLIYGTTMAQTTWVVPPYYQGDSRRVSQRAIHAYETMTTPAGITPAIPAKGYDAPGALFTDSVNNGFYFYSGGIFRNLDEAACNAFNTIPMVTYQGQVLKFSVSASSYNIDCKRYEKDSATVTVAQNDSANGMFAVIYADTTGYHVKYGEPSATPAVPSLEADQLYITTISIPALGTTPTFTSNQIIYFDNGGEGIVTNTGTTTDPNNLTNLYSGTKGINVTNIGNADIVWITAATLWTMEGVDGFVLFIKLKAVLRTGDRLRLQLFNGTSGIGNELNITIDPNNITTYQAVTISRNLFGNLANENFTVVRLRYNTTAGTHAGFYLDNIYLQGGITQPGSGGGISRVKLNGPVGGDWIITGPETGNVELTINPGGTADQYLDGRGFKQDFPDLVDSVGAIDDRAKDDDGFVIDNGVFYGQLANGLYDGLLSKQLWTKISRNDSIQNVGDGDSLLVYVNDSLIGVKTIVFGTAWGTTATEILIDTTGGGGTPTIQQVLTAGNVLGPGQIIDFGSIAFAQFTDGNTGFNYVIGGQNGGVAIGDLNRDVSAVLSTAIIDATEYKIFHLPNITADTDTIADRTWVRSILAGGGGTPTLDDVLTAGDVVTGKRIFIDGSNGGYISFDSGVDTWDFDGAFNGFKVSNQSTSFGTSFDFSLQTALRTIKLPNVNDTIADRSWVRANFGSGGGGGISEVVAGYGLSNVNDSTLRVDSTVIANRAWVTDRIADIDTANIIIQDIGTGQSLWFDSNDSLYMKMVAGSPPSLIEITTLPDSTLQVGLNMNNLEDSLIARGFTSSTSGRMTIGLVSQVASTPADNATLFFGNYSAVPNATATTYEITIDRACTLKSVNIDANSSVAGTNENWSIYVRVNDATDYLIQTLGVSSSKRTWSNSAINISLSAGDKVVMKEIQPNWLTNPTNLIFSGYFTLEF